MIKNVAIGLLSISLLVALFPSKKESIKPADAPLIDTFIDIQYKDTTIYKKGKTIYKDTTIFVEVPTYKVIDTLSILKDYYAKNIYKDTLRLQEGVITILDTISENNIKSRFFTSSIKQKTITREIRIPAPAPKGGLYWGVMGIQSQDGTLGYGGGVMYKFPKNGLIHLSITNTKSLQIGYYSKIF